MSTCKSQLYSSLELSLPSGELENACSFFRVQEDSHISFCLFQHTGFVSKEQLRDLFPSPQSFQQGRARAVDSRSLCWVGCPVHGGRWAASLVSTQQRSPSQPTPKLWWSKMSPDITKCPLGAKPPQLRTTALSERKTDLIKIQNLLVFVKSETSNIWNPAGLAW